MGLSEAQWATGATPLWHLRVLAGWIPPRGAELLRVLVGWWEMRNIENLLVGLTDASSLPSYDLGRLGTAWDRIREADSAEGVRDALATSSWRDPGDSDPATIVVWMHLSWAQRVADEVDVEEGSRMARAWAALVVARLLFVGEDRAPGTAADHLRLLGRDWREAGDPSELMERLPREAAWVLEDVSDPEDLWRAEVRWWRSLHDDGRKLLGGTGSGRERILGAFNLLLADAHRVQGALEFGARGGAEEEMLDEVL